MKQKKKSLKKLPMNVLDLHHRIKPKMNFAHANKSSFTIPIQKSLLEPRNTEIIGPLLRCALLHHPLHCLRHLTSLKESTCPKENRMSYFRLV